jgi:hypothetical protein
VALSDSCGWGRVIPANAPTFALLNNNHGIERFTGKEKAENNRCFSSESPSTYIQATASISYE